MRNDFYLKDVIRTKYKLDFGIAEMDFEFPIRKYMENINKLGYGNPDSQQYSESIKRWFYIQYGQIIDDRYFVYTHSIKYAIKKIIDSCNKVNILNFIPCYNGYNDILNLYRVFDYNYLNLFEECFKEHLETFIIKNKINCIIISNPHNPTGKIIGKEKLEEIVDICSKHNIYLVVDEAYGDIVQNEFFSAVNIEYDNCIVVKTIGKTFNISGVGGAYLIAYNKKICDEIVHEIKSDGLMSPNIFSYYLTECLYSMEGKFWLDDINDIILKNKQYFKQELDSKFRNKLNYELTYGSYLAWVNYDALGISEELFEKILKENKIKVVFSSKYKLFEKYFRVNLACKIEKIDKFIFELEKIINNIS
ncbi:pyridoxal phosphate-dependent aminotransferase [uncultured Megasphaera sp.]|uniref:pyridoxal phosphate-dependent aminotransferase n=1 Tax=uncultured Megasphaera sp. TaxID=165188 RepID=UPI0025928F6F|nr:aminotransferase class I/II-fold pyridoxal phosphate-dependent enzyme [uncultured Megasphaera sp.]